MNLNFRYLNYNPILTLAQNIHCPFAEVTNQIHANGGLVKVQLRMHRGGWNTKYNSIEKSNI
jgi:hypothetical protein